MGEVENSRFRVSSVIARSEAEDSDCSSAPANGSIPFDPQRKRSNETSDLRDSRVRKQTPPPAIRFSIEEEDPDSTDNEVKTLKPLISSLSTWHKDGGQTRKSTDVRLKTRFNDDVSTIPPFVSQLSRLDSVMEPETGEGGGRNGGVVNGAYAESNNSDRKVSAVSLASILTTDTCTPEIDKLPSKVSLNQVAVFFKDSIRSKKKEIYFNCFLSVLVGMILTAIIIFVMINPSDPSYEIHLNTFTTLWPLKKTLFLRHASHVMEPLTVNWGFHHPSTGNSLPSYCRTSNSLAPRCTSRSCCFKYPHHSKLVVTLFNITTNSTVTGCAHMNWQSLAPPDLTPVEFKDCFVLAEASQRLWYGGVLDLNSSWPIKWTNMDKTDALTVELFDPAYNKVVVGDPLNNAGEPLGILEPLWISSDGYMVRIDPEYPFALSVNLNDSHEHLPRAFCLSAKKSLAYTICQADDMRSLVRSARFTDNNINQDVLRDNEDIGSRDKLRNIISLRVDANSINSSNIENEAAMIKKSLASMNEILLPNTVVLFDKSSLFDTEQTSLIKRVIELVKNETEDAEFSATLTNFVSVMHMKDTAQEEVLPNLVWRTGAHGAKLKTRYFGELVWRDKIVSAVDCTRTQVQEWFIKRLAEWPVYDSVQYLHFSGASALQLPAEPSDLNISSEITLGNLNLYTKLFADLVADLSKTVTVASAYRNQPLSQYVIIPATPATIHSIIPIALSLSVQGYNHFALDLIIDDFNSNDAASLSLLFELALFFPVISIPIQVTYPNCNTVACVSFKNVTGTVSHLRNEVIMPYYKRAYLLHKDSPLFAPVFRPVWWDDEASIVSSNALLQTIHIGHQIMIGSDLVLSTLKEGQNKIYLPRGTWRDPLWDGGVVSLSKGQTIIYATKSRISCFIRVSI